MVRHRSVLALILAAIVSSGCVTREGIGISSDPYISTIIVDHIQLADAASDTASGESGAPVTGVIAVGTVSAYREIAPNNAESEYKEYAKSFERWEVDRQPDLGLEDFSSSIRGWTRVKVFQVPMVLSTYFRVLVPREGVEDVQFEPTISTFLFQSGRDLVAARTNSDGAFVIEALLCKDQPGYYECTKRYKYGLFDSETGQKLRLDFKRADGGPWIDPETFQVVDSPF